MNHHLRFPTRPILLTIGAALTASLSLTSCQSETLPPPPPPVAVVDSKLPLQYRIHVIELPDSDTPASPQELGSLSLAGILDEKGGHLFLQDLLNQKGRGSYHTTNIGAKFGQAIPFKAQRDFIYPDEYAPAKFTPPNDPHAGFPVTPATPISFVTTQTGFKGQISAQKASDGNLKLSLKFHRKVLLGFINYGTPITTEGKGFWGQKVEVVLTENRIEMPVFDTKTTDTSLTLQPGQFLVLKGEGSQKNSKIENRSILKASPNVAVLIQVLRP